MLSNNITLLAGMTLASPSSSVNETKLLTVESAPAITRSDECCVVRVDVVVGQRLAHALYDDHHIALAFILIFCREDARVEEGLTAAEVSGVNGDLTARTRFEFNYRSFNLPVPM